MLRWLVYGIGIGATLLLGSALMGVDLGERGDVPDHITADFLTVPDRPSGEGLRSRAYAAYLHGSGTDRLRVARELVFAGYPNAARHLVDAGTVKQLVASTSPS